MATRKARVAPTPRATAAVHGPPATLPLGLLTVPIRRGKPVRSIDCATVRNRGDEALRETTGVHRWASMTSR